MYYLNNSIGGYAPYVSTEGMLMSSTNITNFFPGGGIRITFLFFLCDYNLFSI